MLLLQAELPSIYVSQGCKIYHKDRPWKEQVLQNMRIQGS
jgi:hypothetical protein